MKCFNKQTGFAAKNEDVFREVGQLFEDQIKQFKVPQTKDNHGESENISEEENEPDLEVNENLNFVLENDMNQIMNNYTSFGDPNFFEFSIRLRPHIEPQQNSGKNNYFGREKVIKSSLNSTIQQPH